MEKFKFSANRRLKLKKDFELVFKEGKKLTCASFKMWYKISNCNCSRLGIIISKKLGKAVCRNRIKRIIREVFRLNCNKISKTSDIILYPLKAKTFKNFFEAEKHILSAWEKVRIIQQ